MHKPGTGTVPGAHVLREDAWFAGFVAGEGSFQLSPLRGPRYRDGAFQPRLEISLRNDDAAVLTEIKSAFGGGIKAKQPTRPGQSPQATWVAGSKESLLALVEYFDTFPLRAKKAADYAIWRPAVLLYCSTGYAAPGLVAYADQLRAVKIYGAGQEG